MHQMFLSLICHNSYITTLLVYNDIPMTVGLYFIVTVDIVLETVDLILRLHYTK